ncbi:MAG TPA: calcium-binding protein [Microvirga sp.]|jgi:Ca2+-binding RTX toxin-like protein
MAVKTYGQTYEASRRGTFQEAYQYVSNNAGDRMQGGGAGTIFKGNGGNDVIYGRGGDDVLIGGRGNDVLVGGTEADSFVFNTALGAGNVDRISDFSRRQKDKIVLDDKVFVGLVLTPLANPNVVNNDLGVITKQVGGLQTEAFQLGTTALDADDRVFYDRASGALYFDVDGTGAAAAIKFAQVKKGLLLTASDFLVC